MTNKLPVVGKKYRGIKSKFEITVRECYPEYDAVYFDRYGYYISLSEFWRYFEELPEDNLQQSKQVKVKEEHCGLTLARVLLALEGLIQLDEDSLYKKTLQFGWKIGEPYIHWHLERETLEEQSEEAQLAIAKLLGYKEGGE